MVGIKKSGSRGRAMLLAVAIGLIAIVGYQEYKRNLWRTPHVDSDAYDKISPQVRILPTKFSKSGGYLLDGDSGKGIMGIALVPQDIIEIAYGIEDDYAVFEATLPTNRYDVISKLSSDQIARLDTNSQTALQAEIAKNLALSAVGKCEMWTFWLYVRLPQE